MNFNLVDDYWMFVVSEEVLEFLDTDIRDSNVFDQLLIDALLQSLPCVL